jgi:hypothetical protein
MINSLLLIVVAIYAGTAPLPTRARWYFGVEIMATVIVQILRIGGLSVLTDAYEIIYMITELGTFFASVWVVLEVLKVYKPWMRLRVACKAVVTATLITTAAAYAIQHDYHQLPEWAKIDLGHASLLWLVGGTMAVCVSRLRGSDKVLARVLSVAWIGHSVVLYVYSMKVLENPDFWMNGVVPFIQMLTTLVFAGSCVYLGKRLRVLKKAEA